MHTCWIRRWPLHTHQSKSQASAEHISWSTLFPNLFLKGLESINGTDHHWRWTLLTTRVYKVSKEIPLYDAETPRIPDTGFSIFKQTERSKNDVLKSIDCCRKNKNLIITYPRNVSFNPLNSATARSNKLIKMSISSEQSQPEDTCPQDPCFFFTRSLFIVCVERSAVRSGGVVRAGASSVFA